MSHEPNVADALDRLREIAALLPERNRLQHAANQAKAGRRFSMAEMSEASAERCLTTAERLANEAIDLLTNVRGDTRLVAFRRAEGF